MKRLVALYDVRVKLFGYVSHDRPNFTFAAHARARWKPLHPEKKYDSIIVWLYNQGQKEHLLSEEIPPYYTLFQCIHMA